MARSRGPVLLLLGILAALNARADERRLTTIPLRHQVPSQVLPVIQPLLGDGSTAAEFSNQLVLNVTDEELARIRELLDAIDRRPRDLLITVRTPSGATGRNRGVAVDGSIGNENVRIGAGDGRVSDGDGLRIGIEASTTDASGTQQQQVRAIEGMPAQISIGVLAPVTSTYTRADGRRVTTREYYPVNQGVSVVARVVEGRVILDLDQQNNRLAGAPGASGGNRQGTYDAPAIRTQAIRTQVSGPIGAWIDLGRIEQTREGSSRGLDGATEGSVSEVSAVMIKVEVVGE